MSLRATALRGATYLAGREVLGIVVRLGGVLLLARLLGPANYGIYAAAAAFVNPLAVAAQLGAEIYLIRRRDDPPEDLYHQVWTVLVGTTTVVGLFGFGLSFVIDDWLQDERYVAPFRVLLLSLPINVLWAPAQAKLERALRYKRMAAIELSGDIVLYSVAIGLALVGLGVWAPVAGYLAWQSWLLVASYALSAYRPRIRLSRATGCALFRHGAGYVPASLLTRGAEYVVNPLVVGRFLGPDAVGLVAMSLRLADNLSFVSRATWRLSVAALARVQDDVHRFERGVQDAMMLQVLVLGPILASFSIAAPWAIPTLFGEEWAVALDYFPFAAASFLLATLFIVHNSVFYVRGVPGVVALVTFARVALLAGVGMLLVPRLGLTGYGVATVAPIVAVLLSERLVRRWVRLHYAHVAAWILAFLGPVFGPLVDFPASLALWAPLAAAVALPGPRRSFIEYGRSVATALRPRTPVAE
jgi:O-antigen/teichoic acid export membrane protein